MSPARNRAACVASEQEWQPAARHLACAARVSCEFHYELRQCRLCSIIAASALSLRTCACMSTAFTLSSSVRALMWSMLALSCCRLSAPACISLFCILMHAYSHIPLTMSTVSISISSNRIAATTHALTGSTRSCPDDHAAPTQRAIPEKANELVIHARTATEYGLSGCTRIDNLGLTLVRVYPNLACAVVFALRPSVACGYAGYGGGGG